MTRRLYRGAGTRARELREFQERYGPRGVIVYGAVVGKVKREQEAKVAKRRRHGYHHKRGCRCRFCRG